LPRNYWSESRFAQSMKTLFLNHHGTAEHTPRSRALRGFESAWRPLQSLDYLAADCGRPVSRTDQTRCRHRRIFSRRSSGMGGVAPEGRLCALAESPAARPSSQTSHHRTVTNERSPPWLKSSPRRDKRAPLTHRARPSVLASKRREGSGFNILIGKKRSVMLANFSQRMNARWLRRLSGQRCLVQAKADLQRGEVLSC
jgi:hypothetical protein